MTRPGHPSGRPVRRPRTVGRGYWNAPGEGFATPRLREARRDLSLVGFHRGYAVESDERADTISKPE